MKNMTDIENVPFETLLERLEENVDQLESGDVPLEKALEIFENGIKLSKELSRRLSSAEEKIKKLTADAAGEPVVEDFEED